MIFGDIEREEPPVEAGRREGPLEEILIWLPGRGAPQQGGDLLECGRTHAAVVGGRTGDQR